MSSNTIHKLPKKKLNAIHGAKQPVKEIMIAAKLRGAQSKSKGDRAPAYSFGIKLQKEMQSPGPASFLPVSGATRLGVSKGAAFSLKGSYAKRDVFGLDTPGPGKYYPKFFPTKDSQAPSYSIGKLRMSEKANNDPGPAAYDIHSTLGMHPSITVSAPAALEQISPGPAAYNPPSPSKIKKKSPAYALVRGATTGGIKKTDSLDTLGPTPGPGQYTPKLGFVRAHIPQFSFRCKHSDYELFIPDSNNAEFSF